MDINEFAKEVHENAVAHGWWEKPDLLEKIGLIHSEWSEALEEYRAGRPMVWHACKTNGEPHPCELCTDCASKHMNVDCSDYDAKPEGIAVELIDGVIRTLDLLKYMGADIHESLEEEMMNIPNDVVEMPLPVLVTYLHFGTSTMAYAYVEDKAIPREFMLTINVACAWVKNKGIAPDAVLREKHEYNKTRAYKHGGKIC